MKVAYCATVQPSFGGLKTFNVGLVESLYRYCLRNGMDFILITHQSHLDSFSIPDTVKRSFTGNHFLFESFQLPVLLKTEKVDWAIFPHNRLPFFFTGSRKSAVIIHDLLFWRFPAQFSFLKRISRYLFMSMALRKADSVISVSEFTKQELVDFGFKNPVHVCLEGVSPMPQEAEDAAVKGRMFPVDKPFFLFIGAFSFQKNLPALVEAFEKVKAKGLDCRLILAGGKGSETEKMQSICAQSSCTTDILTPGYISDSEKTWLLKNCLAFVFPSVYEGFGIPLLEAFQIGAPVICSNKASLPEVAGDGAKVTAPDASSLAEAMMELSENPGLRQTYVEKGRRRLSFFDWDKVASAVAQPLV